MVGQGAVRLCRHAARMLLTCPQEHTSARHNPEGGIMRVLVREKYTLRRGNQRAAANNQRRPVAGIAMPLVQQSPAFAYLIRSRSMRFAEAWARRLSG